MNEDPRTVEPTTGAARRRIGCGTWAILGVVVGVAAALLVSAALFTSAVREGRALYTESIGRVVGPQPTPVLQARSVVLQQLREASELTTAIFTMETVVTESMDRTLAGLTIGSTDLIYVAHGQVRAGVNLNELEPDAVTVDEAARTIMVHLPAPRIQDAKIDVDKSFVYNIDRSLFGPADKDLQSRAESFALERIVESACESGIQAEANSRAVLAIRTLLITAGYEAVVVETTSPSADECLWPAPVSSQ